MKIRPSFWSPPVQPSPDVRTSAHGVAPGTTATRVSVSPEARWIADLRDQARELPEVRDDVVERTRAALRDGSYEASVDLDAVIDRLLAGE